MALTNEMHKAQLRASAARLLLHPPPGHAAWDVHRVRRFKDVCEALHKAATLPKLREAAAHVAIYYGTTLQAIDPEPGA